MKLKLTLIFLTIIVLGALAYFGYPVIKSRYFENEENSMIIRNDKDIPTENNPGESEETTNDNDSEIPVGPTDESGDNPNINAEDCDNECDNFKNNADDLKYCQNVCGLSPIKDSKNCESKTGLDKDYCFKNQAVAETDIKICDLISDSNIKSACKNRVTEDLMENQQ